MRNDDDEPLKKQIMVFPYHIWLLSFLSLALTTTTTSANIGSSTDAGGGDGKIAKATYVVLWLLGAGGIAWIIYYCYYVVIKKQKLPSFSLTTARKTTAASSASSDDDDDSTKATKNAKPSLLDTSNSVSVKDLEFLSNTLRPDSTYWEVLTAVLATPETVEWSVQDLERVAATRRERRERDRKEQQKLESSGDQQKKIKADLLAFDDLVNQGGWDEDNDDDEDHDKAAKAAAAEKERKQNMELLKQAQGQGVILLEGVDDGVLGQAWVEATLQAAGVWPPRDLGVLTNMTFDWDGLDGDDDDNGQQQKQQQKQVGALQHPGVRRILCMTVGRLNSMMLNSHQDLLEAGSKQRIDQTYFKASMEFRSRVSMLLEAALRIAVTMRSQRLLATVIETVAMFKIGVKHDERTIPWFNTFMTRQYNILPRLKINSRTVTTVDGGHAVICPGDISEVLLEVERIHAENFLKVKAEMFKQQGIPPQVGLQSYREGWWFMLRVKRLDDDDDGTAAEPAATPPPTEPLFTESSQPPWTVDPVALSAFETEAPEYRLLTAWPMIIQNIAQQKGKIKIQFKAPAVPGKYRYYVGIKSQDFFGADQEVELDVTVVEAATVTRSKPKEADNDESKIADNDEPKKDK